MTKKRFNELLYLFAFGIFSGAVNQWNPHVWFWITCVSLAICLIALIIARVVETPEEKTRREQKESSKINIWFGLLWMFVLYLGTQTGELVVKTVFH